MNSKITRVELAQHFHALTKISREEIFGDKDADMMPVNFRDDAMTMFSGFVGKNFRSGESIIIFGINPGGGGNAKQHPDDKVFYPLLRDFKSADRDSVADKFEKINAAFASIVQKWNLWRILAPTLEAAGLDIDSIAYMNVVPYRTREDKTPPVLARKTSWSSIVAPTLVLLRPRAIIALGKKAGAVVKPLLTESVNYYCVPRTIGDSYISGEAKLVLKKISQDFLDY